jgi:hypothetical protein
LRQIHKYACFLIFSMALAFNAFAGGNVTVSDAGGNLVITGDANGNNISVRTVLNTTWEVKGIGTTVNGLHSFISAAITGNVTINMGDGKDKVTVHDANVPTNLTILMGSDADKTTLKNVTLGEFLHYEGNEDNDNLKISKLTVLDTDFSSFSTADGQDGNDKMKLVNCIDQDLEITLGNGNDKLSISKSTYLGGPFQRLNIDAGFDTDKVTLNQVRTGPLQVLMSDGDNDKLLIKKSTADTNDLDGGNGLGDKLILKASTLGTGTPINFE